jgi:hypothetical protein
MPKGITAGIPNPVKRSEFDSSLVNVPNEVDMERTGNTL